MSEPQSQRRESTRYVSHLISFDFRSVHSFPFELKSIPFFCFTIEIFWCFICKSTMHTWLYLFAIRFAFLRTQHHQKRKIAINLDEHQKYTRCGEKSERKNAAPVAWWHEMKCRNPLHIYRTLRHLHEHLRFRNKSKALTNITKHKMFAYMRRFVVSRGDEIKIPEEEA